MDKKRDDRGEKEYCESSGIVVRCLMKDGSSCLEEAETMPSSAAVIVGRRNINSPNSNPCKEGYSRPGTRNLFFLFVSSTTLELVVFPNLFPSPKKAKTQAEDEQ